MANGLRNDLIKACQRAVQACLAAEQVAEIVQGVEPFSPSPR